MKLRTALAASAAALGLLLTIQANAATYNFSYTGLDGANTITTTGTLTTDSTAPSITYSGASGSGPNVYGYDVLSITGTRTDGAVTQQITGLVGTSGSSQFVWPSSSPASPPPGWNFDNIVYMNTAAPTAVDLLGVEYAAVSDGVTSLYNVYFQNGTYFENFTPLTGGSVSAVPLPAALPLFGAVVAGLGIFGWRKKHLTSAI